MRFDIGLAFVALVVVSACQKPATAAPPAAVSPAVAAQTAAVTRILALSTMDRCTSETADLPAPTKTQVIDFGGGAFGVLADCTQGTGAPSNVLFIQGPDGVLKRQWLVTYNGPEYDPDYQWEPGAQWNTQYDAATKVFTVAFETPTDDGPATRLSTMRWRWDATKLAMIDASRVTHATPGAAATGLVTGYPKTPAITDPTPEATPI